VEDEMEEFKRRIGNNHTTKRFLQAVKS